MYHKEILVSLRGNLIFLARELQFPRKGYFVSCGIYSIQKNTQILNLNNLI